MVDPWAYPVQALRFLAQNDIVGNVALALSLGRVRALVAARGHARRRRRSLHHRLSRRSLLADAWRFMSGEPGLGRAPQATTRPTSSWPTARQAPARLLRDHREWQYVYSDPVSIVFVRETGAGRRAGALHGAAQLLLRPEPRSDRLPRERRARCPAASRRLPRLPAANGPRSRGRTARGARFLLECSPHGEP